MCGLKLPDGKSELLENESRILPLISMRSKCCDKIAVIEARRSLPFHVLFFLSQFPYMIRCCEVKARVITFMTQSDLLRQFQLGAVVLAVGVKAHEVRHGRIQEVQQRSRQDGHVDVLPLEREH